MISIDFFAAQGALTGFSAHGHADTAPYGEDIVCAAVSSACLLTANTITEVLHLPAAAKMKDGFLQLRLSGDTAPAQVLLQGLKLHLSALSEQYPQSIQGLISEG